MNIIQFFEFSVAKFPNNPFLWQKENGVYSALTYQETHQQVSRFAAGLILLGLNPSDKVALLSEGRNEWLISELAILFNGGINVPLSTKLEADSDLIFRINHSESKFIVTSKFQLAKIRLILPQLKLIEKIILLDEITPLGENEITKSEIDRMGEELLTTQPELLNERKVNVSSNHIATISYTSGTTADPKGIMLTHRNYTANVEQAFSYIDIPEYYRTLVVLPWDHAFAHTASLYSFMHTGASIASVQTGATQMETLKNFTNNMLEIQPHVLMSVPSLAKNFRKNIEKGIQSKGKITEWLFVIGLKTAYWYIGNGQNKGKGHRKMAFPIYVLFRKIIFNKIKEKFGGNLKFFIGGGALLDAELQKFFYAIDMPMFQGYGLTEAAPIISANTPKYHIIGTSGKIVNHLEVKICDDDGNELPIGEKGEIVIRGENVMAGYWRNEAATEEVLRNGWLYTGDLGYLQKDHYLNVLGRFKSLLISSDGEKYSPEGIEEAMIEHSSWIDQIMLHNNQNPYTIALLVPNKEKCIGFLKQHHLSASKEEDLIVVLNHLQNEANQFKKGGKYQDLFPQRWMPAVVMITDQSFTEENKLMNSTLKMVRGKICDYYKETINLAYTPVAKEISNPLNIKNLQSFLMTK